jgi:hypothetical protein
MNQNETPRTDAAVNDVLQTGPCQKVSADFARQLERELAEAKKALHDLQRKSL